MLLCVSGQLTIHYVTQCLTFLHRFYNTDWNYHKQWNCWIVTVTVATPRTVKYWQQLTLYMFLVSGLYDPSKKWSKGKFTTLVNCQQPFEP